MDWEIGVLWLGNMSMVMLAELGYKACSPDFPLLLLPKGIKLRLPDKTSITE